MSTVSGPHSLNVVGRCQPSTGNAVIVPPEVTLTMVLPLCFSVASISTGGSRKSFASSIRNLVEV
jgi:hypothetical protein